MTNDQATFDSLLQQGFRLVCVSGYAENGQARYAAIWEQGAAGRSRLAGSARALAEPISGNLNQMAADGFAPVQVCGYRINVDVRFGHLGTAPRPWLGRTARADLSRISKYV